MIKKVLYIVTSIAMSVINAVYIWLVVYLCLCIFAELSGLFRIIGYKTEPYIITIVGTIIVFVSVQIIKLVKYKIHSKKDESEIEYTGEERLSFFKALGHFIKSLFFRSIQLAVLLIIATTILSIFNGFEDDNISDVGVWCMCLFLLLTVRFIVLRVQPRTRCNDCGCKNSIVFRGSQKGEEYYSTYRETSEEKKYRKESGPNRIHTYRDSSGKWQVESLPNTYDVLEEIRITNKFYDNVKFCNYTMNYECVVCGQKYYKIHKHMVDSIINRTPDSIEYSKI